MYTGGGGWVRKYPAWWRSQAGRIWEVKVSIKHLWEFVVKVTWLQNILLVIPHWQSKDICELSTWLIKPYPEINVYTNTYAQSYFFDTAKCKEKRDPLLQYWWGWQTSQLFGLSNAFLTKDSISPYTYFFILILLHFHVQTVMTAGWNLHGSCVDS